MFAIDLGNSQAIIFESARLTKNKDVFFVRLISISTNLFRLLDCSLQTVRGKPDSSKVRFEIGWHLTFRMKVNSIAQRIGARASELYANNRPRDTYWNLIMTHIHVQGFHIFGIRWFQNRQNLKVCFVSIPQMHKWMNEIIWPLNINIEIKKVISTVFPGTNDANEDRTIDRERRVEWIISLITVLVEVASEWSRVQRITYQSLECRKVVGPD